MDSYMYFFYLRAPQQMLRTHRSLEAYYANLVMKTIKFFLLFHFNGATVERN
jgi:hypothetical protein